MRLAGIQDQSAIARQLGVSNATISLDFAALDLQYQASALADTTTLKGQQLERVERLIQALWREAIGGRWLAIDRIIKLFERQAALLGLDAPQKVDIELRLRREAAEAGLDPDEVVAEARKILAEAKG